MTEPSRPSPATAKTTTESQGPVDPTVPRADTVSEPPTGAGSVPDFAPPRHSGEIGTLGRYRVLKELGRGGMGAVYLGYDSALDRKVALKVMLPDHAANRDARERFLREARTAAMVRSDHVVTIFDVAEERGIPFIAMQYLLGHPLDQYLKTKGELPLAHVLRVGRETALGLAAAHDLGLIHRDIKPGNLWLEAPKGRVKLLDFGLARAENDDVHLTNTGAVVGTPAYMSPEQGRGLKVDHRSDLFSLGVLLYRLCTEKLPFRGANTMAILTSLAVDTPTPVRQLNPEAPEALEVVIHRLLAKNPDERFQIAMEVVAALRDIEQPKSVAGPLPVVVPLPVQPLVVGAQTQNVWEGIVDSESVPVPPATSAETEVEPAAAPKPHRKQPERKPSMRPVLLAGAALLVAVAALAVLAITLLRPSKGTLIIESDDPDVELVIKKDGKIVRDRTKDREIELEVGNYTAELADKKDKLKLDTDRFAITKKGQTRIRVSPEKPKPPPPPPDPDRKAAEYVLSIGGIAWVNGEGKDIKTKDELPRDRFSLTAVSLRSNTNVTDTGLASFEGCKNLTSLDLTLTKVSDAGLAHFKDCKSLERLGLWNTPVSDAGLAHFKDCKSLTMLQLTGTQVSDAGLAHFKDCKNLTFLDLRGTQVGNAGLANFKDCKNLGDLCLGNTQVSDAGMVHFKNCKNLTVLDLSNTAVGDTGLENFKDCKNLTELWVYNTKVSDTGLAYFDDCKNLTHLSLDNTEVSDVGLAYFKNCKNLQHIKLIGCKQVGDAGLANFKDCKGLTYLSLNNTQVSNAGLAYFKDCKQLTFLNVKQTKVAKEAVAEFAKAMPQCEIEWDEGTIKPKK